MNVQVRIPGTEHWTSKGDVRLFLWNKVAGDPANTRGTILFVHGSSMASQPTFDLEVPGRPDSSVMEYFAKQGYDTWCVDMEGYGRSTKDRDNNAPIAFGADDCFAAATYIQKLRGPRPLLVHGISSGALRAALFAERPVRGVRPPARRPRKIAGKQGPECGVRGRGRDRESAAGQQVERPVVALDR